MSFSADVKKELTFLQITPENAKIELSALVRMNGFLTICNRKIYLNIKTENAAIARHIYILLKTYQDINSKFLVDKKRKLKKNNIYILRIKKEIKKLLKNLNILNHSNNFYSTIIKNEKKIRSYLRGAFISSGSINKLESSRYHLEIYSIYEEYSQEICSMLNYFKLNARQLERRNGYIIYLKEADKISNFLTLIGATNSMLKFENIRVFKYMKNSTNRLVNCETANMTKTIQAASKQLNDIKFLKKIIGLDKLPNRIQELANMRLKNPDISLRELGQIIPSGSVSKSCINHRIRKIRDLVKDLKNKGF